MFVNQCFVSNGIRRFILDEPLPFPKAPILCIHQLW